MYLVILEREDCTMCGTCVETADTLFTFDDDDKATMIGSEREDEVDEIEVEDMEQYKDAMNSCKGECIEVYDDDGNPV